ncbi:MAG: glycosyltransferase family 9 protein [Candidatus Parcubacteria bacterium]|nr:glycosyltransferase family 9 protein [Burkholderiales bacterium]
MAIHTDGAPRILIVRRDNIGDLACTTPLIAGLRAQLPRAWLGALVTTYNAEVLARNPALDEVFVYEKLKHRSGGLISHLRTRLGQISRLRQRQFDCVLVPAPSPQSLKLARSLKPRELLAAPATFPASLHEVERVFAMGRPFGVAGAPGPMAIFPDPGKQKVLGKQIGDGPFIAVHISARRPAQQWPLERYAALLVELQKSWRVMLLWAPGSTNNPGHPGDDEAARRILDAANGGRVVPVATPDLGTLIAALSLAKRVVCADGGAMHLAAALGKPVVALFGDSPVARWRPWGVEHRVLRPEARDLADLPLEPVLEAVQALG